MKMCSIGLAAQFGICEIDNKTKKIGNIYGLYYKDIGQLERLQQDISLKIILGSN
jgi:hypothetical protein